MPLQVSPVEVPPSQGGETPTVEPARSTVDAVRQALREVVDPELGMNVVDLGLIYELEVSPGSVRVVMTMTSPACPMGPMIVDDARDRIRALAPGVEVDVRIAWEPEWSPELMSEDAKRRLGWG